MLDTIPQNEYTILSNLPGVLLAADLDPDEQNLPGNFFVAVGQALVTVAAQSINIQSHRKADSQSAYIRQQLDILGKQVDMLKQQVGRKF